MTFKNKNFFAACLLLTVFYFLFFIFSFVEAASLEKSRNFYVDSGYDISGRKEISAGLNRIGNYVYFYIDNSWWEKLDSSKQSEINQEIYELSNEFERNIYPTLTSVFGKEWRPGIDNDLKITVLIHPMKKNVGGYFNSGDEYSRLENPFSNQREMVYLNADYITNSLNKSFLAHEFVHLITFNKKEKIQGIEEEIWLNEARAEYAPTLCGYDSGYKESNLQRRIKRFLEEPNDSLTEWQNSSADYGALNLFIQYLVDHYGVEILKDSMQSSKIGIPSLNYALKKNGFEENFSQIFTDWTITVLVNNCDLGEKYCYKKNENLKDLKIVPISNFLPLTSESSLSVGYTTKNWAGNWQKIFGGKGTLTLDFEGTKEVKFKVPYLVCQKSNSCSIHFLTLDENQKAQIVFPDFNEKYAFLTIIPSIQNKFSGFNGSEKRYSFSWRVSAKEEIKEKEEEELIKKLLAQIAYLEAEIAKIKAQIQAILMKKELNSFSGQRFENDLYYGMSSNSEVRCLQQFLGNQGQGIYPEGLVTGNFLSLTNTAVIRFQEKYALEILKPLGLARGTGFVGPRTRARINQLLGS